MPVTFDKLLKKPLLHNHSGADISGDFVTVSQLISQTIGDTTNRLTKLWATDITVTNAIVGSITGNAGTVTNGLYTTDIGLLVQAYDADLTTWAGITPGTGVATALAVNVGSAGAFVVNGGALGTPSSGIATNLTGTASGLTAGNVTTNANLTGVITSIGNETSIASQTGTGTKFVVDTSPTLVTPILGVASATSLAVPTITTASGALGITPASGSNLNITLATTGDLAVNTDDLYVDTSTGRVGIGTTGPSSKLHISDTTSSSIGWQSLTLTSSDALAVDKGGSIGFGGVYTGSTLANWGWIRGLKENATDGNTSGYLAFGTRTSGQNTLERVRITSAGNVGIGTTAPTSLLDITSTTGGIITVRRNDTSITANDMVGKIQFYAADASTTTNFIVADIEAQATNTVATDINPGRLIFRTTSTTVAATPTERLRIDENGDFTIADTGDFILSTGTGTKFGTATTQKLAFYNSTPIVQPSAYTQTYSTASKTVANPTAATLTDSTGGTADTTLAAVEATYTQATIRNNFADLAAMVNKLTADQLADKKVITQLIDDLQSLGLVG